MDVPPFQILDTRDSFLSVYDHLRKKVCKASAAKLGRSCAIQVTVIDCLAIGRGAEAWIGRGAWSRLGRRQRVS